MKAGLSGATEKNASFHNDFVELSYVATEAVLRRKSIRAEPVTVHLFGISKTNIERARYKNKFAVWRD